MTNIRTNCPRCGEVEMEASVVVLTLEQTGDEGVYSFVCPECLDVVEKPADRKVVSLLLSAGVEVAGPPDAAQATEARHEGPPLTVDDLIDFHFLLSGDNWFDSLLASAD